MALKDFDTANPRTRDKNWKEEIQIAELPKTDEWYPYRVVGGIFSYAQHWIEFVNKTGEPKRYPVDCANWDPSTESSTKKGGCPACEAGLRPSVRYMMNVVDRTAQKRGDADPIRALDIPPTVMKQLIDLKKLNMVKGEPRSIAHPKFGCDIFLQKQKSAKRGGVEWQAQKGERTALTEEEASLDLIPFDDHWMEPDVHKIREDLKRHGYFNDDDAKASSKGAGAAKSEKSKRPSEDEDDFDVPKKSTRKPPSDDDDDAAPSTRSPAKASAPARKAAPVDDDEDDDAPPPRKASVPAKKAPVDDDEDDDAPPPRKAAPPAKKAAPVDDDEDDDAPPRKASPGKKAKPADDFEDDFDDV